MTLNPEEARILREMLKKKEFETKWEALGKLEAFKHTYRGRPEALQIIEEEMAILLDSGTEE